MHERRWLRLAAAWAVALRASAALAAEPVAPDDVESLDWGATPNVTRVERLFFAGQPDRAGLEAARAAGVGVVVNLRGEDELASLPFDERAAVESLGMRYRHVPIRKGEPLTADVFAEIDRVVAAQPDERILVHCSSSNRAGAWFAFHLAGEHGMEPDAALAVGRRTGLTHPQLEEAVRAVLPAR